jgi:hypothetical protein
MIMKFTWVRLACKPVLCTGVGTQYERDNWPITWTLNPLVRRAPCVCVLTRPARSPAPNVPHTELPFSGESLRSIGRATARTGQWRLLAMSSTVSGTWRRVVWYKFTFFDVSEEFTAPIFKGQRLNRAGNQQEAITGAILAGRLCSTLRMEALRLYETSVVSDCLFTYKHSFRSH